MALFPSVEWFDEVRRVFNANEEYHGAGGGACEALMGVKVGSEVYLVRFEGLESTHASKITEQQLADVDFYLEMEFEEWREMILNIKQNGTADLGYTLNTLDLDREQGLAKSVSGDQYKEDMFFRYNQTLQFFFDASSQIDTAFS